MTRENESKENEPLKEAPTELVQPVGDDGYPGWRDIFRQAFEKARRESQPPSRSGLGRDRSRSLFLLAASAVALLLLFLGVFSSPNGGRKSAHARPPRTPNLGQKATPGEQAAGHTGSATPMLNAQTSESPSELAGSTGVTAEDVDKTARPVRPSIGGPTRPTVQAPGKAGPYALGRIAFSDVAAGERAIEPASSEKSESDDLRKPSLVFVRNVQNAARGNGNSLASMETEETPTLALPSGTRLIARLESAVTSAVKEPVVAAIEYNYERDGEIVVPAGAKALGSLDQADRSGTVGIRFNMIQMPDGTTEKIDATAMSLAEGPLKGSVSGKKTGTNFLVRTFTGLGEAATYLVGSGGLSAPLSESAFLRDRIATNVGIAGDQELNNLTFNQNIVVTVPGNTRFYLVIEHDVRLPEGQTRASATRPTNAEPPPSMEELRQLLELRQEMSAMYQQESGAQSAAQPAPEQ